MMMNIYNGPDDEGWICPACEDELCPGCPEYEDNYEPYEYE